MLSSSISARYLFNHSPHLTFRHLVVACPLFPYVPKITAYQRGSPDAYRPAVINNVGSGVTSSVLLVPNNLSIVTIDHQHIILT